MNRMKNDPGIRRKLWGDPPGHRAAADAALNPKARLRGPRYPSPA
jgi:hypothetical protein